MGKENERLRKVKWFSSLLKERDWLESMAEEGWLLTNITWGIIYEFKKIEPTEKVYEIDRFVISSHAQKKEIMAKKLAFDIAEQVGWEIVTHDEDMNYYFVKDRTDDGEDEFYDTEEMRKERAEKYRARYEREQPLDAFGVMILVSILGMVQLILWGDMAIDLCALYMGFILLMVAAIWYTVAFGEIAYKELLLSREQWELRKKYGEKKHFFKVDEALTYLDEKSLAGLILMDYENKKYFFEKCADQYAYYIDTKKAVLKRLKAQNIKYVQDKKDWSGLSTQWQEISMQEAEKRGLEMVCVVEGGSLIYRKKAVGEKVQWDTGAIYMGGQDVFRDKLKKFVIIVVSAFLVGLCAGYFAKYFL